MARTDSKEKRAAREETLSTILTVPGVVKEPVWQELADEAEVYLGLYKRLSKEPLDSPEREAIEDRMILSLAHLSTHSQVLYASVDEAIEVSSVNELEHQDKLQKPVPGDEEEEIFEQLEAGLSAQEGILNFLNFLNERTTNHGEQIHVQSLKIDRINTSKSSQAKKTQKIEKVLSDIASLIDRYTNEISENLPKYRNDVGHYVGAYSKFIFWASSMDHGSEAQKQELHRILKDLRETLRDNTKSISEFINNVQGTGYTASNIFKHEKLKNACDRLANILIGILDTGRELSTFTEDIFVKLGISK